MSKKASEDELAGLHGAIARGLTGIINEGVPVVVHGEEGDEVIKAPASAAYYMAGITLLKNNSITADPSGNKDLEELTKALKERRERHKARLTSREVAGLAEEFERDLGGGFPQ